MITLNEMLDAINESGYLIEQRVANYFIDKSYSVIPNQIIVDPTTNIRREIDFVAIKLNYNSENKDHYGYEFICECENNHEPIVFFPVEFDKYRYVSELKNSGFSSMLNIFKKNSQKLPLTASHIASQYCSFKKIKPKDSKEKKWIALHQDKQHDTLTKLKKSVQHRRDTFKISSFDFHRIQGRIHIPLLVLNDNIYIWKENDQQNPLSQINHLLFVIQDYNENNNVYENYYIDVVTEEYLPEYLINKELQWQFLDYLIKSNRERILVDQKNNMVRFI